MKGKIKSYFSANDKFAGHNDVHLLEVGPGRAVAEMKVQAHHLNFAGVVHGGALFTLADAAFAAACNSAGRLSLAVSITMNFIKPATGGMLRAECDKVAGGKLATYRATVTDEKGDVCAVFQGLAYQKKEALPLD